VVRIIIGMTTTAPLTIDDHVFNFFPADFPQQGPGIDRVQVGRNMDWSRVDNGEIADAVPLRIHNARELHGTDEQARVENFHRTGFVLLPHKTKVRDWDEDPLWGIVPKGGVNPVVPNDIRSIYHPEIEGLIRNVLLTEYHVIKIMSHDALLRRGPGSKNDFYGTGVHQDFGATPADVAINMDCHETPTRKIHEDILASEGCRGLIVINWWRPINLVDRKLKDKPLAVCDASTVQTEDQVFTGLDTTILHGNGELSSQMALRVKEQHKWYYYPDMKSSEVLVFKQFEWWKTDANDRTKIPVRSAFHSAFIHPDTPRSEPARQSTEYRVFVYIGDRKTEAEMAEAQLWVATPESRSCDACKLM